MRCPHCGYDFEPEDEEEPMRADQEGHTLPLYVYVDNTGGIPA